VARREPASAARRRQPQVRFAPRRTPPLHRHPPNPRPNSLQRPGPRSGHHRDRPHHRRDPPPAVLTPSTRVDLWHAPQHHRRGRLPLPQHVENTLKPLPRNRGGESRIRLLRTASSQVREMLRVEVAGIEPASFDTEPGLLRAELAMIFLASTVTRASC
jgi:hypothetical protein